MKKLFIQIASLIALICYASNSVAVVTENQLNTIRNYYNNEIKDYGTIEIKSIMYKGMANYIVLFNDKDKADAFSAEMASLGIKSSSGNPKYVAKHLENNDKFGIVLVEKDIDKLLAHIGWAHRLGGQ